MDTNEESMCVYVGGGRERGKYKHRVGRGEGSGGRGWGGVGGVESLPREVICNLRGTE